MTYWKQLHAFVQQEDVREVDRFFMSHLQELGIKKGKEFKLQVFRLLQKSFCSLIAHDE